MRTVTLRKKEIELILYAISDYETMGDWTKRYRVRKSQYDIAQSITEKLKDLYPDFYPNIKQPKEY